jgi:hypothetical protein
MTRTRKILVEVDLVVLSSRNATGAAQAFARLHNLLLSRRTHNICKIQCPQTHDHLMPSSALEST